MWDLTIFIYTEFLGYKSCNLKTSWSSLWGKYWGRRRVIGSYGKKMQNINFAAYPNQNIAGLLKNYFPASVMHNVSSRDTLEILALESLCTLWYANNFVWKFIRSQCYFC